jgi:hypothetical protein
MRQPRKGFEPSSPHLFVSFKTATAIPFATTLRRDILLQCSLDARFSRIEYIPLCLVYGQAVRLDAVVLTLAQDGARYAVDVPDAQPLRDVDDEGLALLALGNMGIGNMRFDAGDVRREPKLTNSRTVWGCHGLAVAAHDRAAILEFVASGSVSIGEVGERLDLRIPALFAVGSMACDGAVSLDLSAGQFGIDSVVSSPAPWERPSPALMGGRGGAA